MTPDCVNYVTRMLDLREPKSSHTLAYSLRQLARFCHFSSVMAEN